MAYDFSSDPNCVALWRFEDGALTVDSKGSNTLTVGPGTPTADLATYQEGSASAHFDQSGTAQYYYINDASLPAGFPFKNGDSLKQISIALWWTPESHVSQYTTIIGKCTTFVAGLGLCQYGEKLYVRLPWGGSNHTYNTEISLVDGKSYHIGLRLNGLTGSFALRVLDLESGVVQTYHDETLNAITTNTERLYIGTGFWPATGNIDQLAVFSDLLTDEEMDEISGAPAQPTVAGMRFYFPGDLAADIIGEGLEPAYDDNWDAVSDYPASPHARSVRQKMVPVADKTFSTVYEYSAYAEDHTSPYNFMVRQFISDPLAAQTISGKVKGQVCAYQQTDNDEDSFCRAMVIKVVSGDGTTVRGTLLSHFPEALVSKFPYYGEPDGPDAPQNREFPPADTALTSVTALDGDRMVVEFGGLYIGSSPQAYGEALMYFGDKDRNGDLPEDETETLYAYYAPWVEFDERVYFQGETVPEEGEVESIGGVEVGGETFPTYANRPTYVVVVDEETTPVSSVGGVLVGGKVVPVFVVPAPLDVGDIEVGGVVIGGSPVPVFVVPDTYAVLVTGGIVIGGRTKPVFVDPTEDLTSAAVYLPTVTGGVLVGGATAPVFVTPLTYLAEVKGGVRVSGPAISGVQFVAPAGVAGISISASGGIVVGGETFPVFVVPPVYRVPVDPRIIANILIGGGGGVAFITPQVFVAEVEGDVIVGAETELDTDEVYETWALGGKNNEPSIISGYRFNSYALINGKAYAAADDGLYVIGGENDNGEVIHPGVRIGPMNFGLDCKKRLRAINVGRAGPDTKVRVEVVDGAEGTFTHRSDPRRITIDRNLEGEEFYIDIIDFVELSHLEIIPLVLFKK